MTLNDHFALNSVFRRYVWSSEAWLSKLSYSYSECCRRTSNRKEHCIEALRGILATARGFLVFSRLLPSVLVIYDG